MLYPLSYEGRGWEGYRPDGRSGDGHARQRAVCNTDPQ